MRSSERFGRAGSEMECAERETKGSGLFGGKENLPERGEEAMVLAGEVKVLPIRDVRL